MGKSQREKGARAERSVAKILNDHGFPARRGMVFVKEPDVICDSLPLHLEIKFQEVTKIHDWMRQSIEQSRGLIPTVVHKRSREEWLITMRFEDFLDFISSGNAKERNENDD